MREGECGRMEGGCSESRPHRPGTPEAPSGSHDWHTG